jgi:hypothetical protein
MLKLLRDYDDQFLGLLIDILPRITASRAWKARKAFTPAFIDYYERGLDKNANAFVKARRRNARTHGFTNQDLGSFDMLILHTALVNTVPNAFSMLARIVSDPVLTAEISEEVAFVATRTTVDGVDHVALDIAAFNAKGPILVSTFQENIRMCVNATSVRVVQEDVLLKEGYFLKKGGVVQVSGGAIQESSKYWGSDAPAFNPYRFLKTTDLTREQKKAQSKGLLPFGGGKHLCPGRQLAFVEIVSFLGMLVYGFEVRMKDGSLVKPPPYKKQDLGQNSKSPEHDIDVVIRRKEEFKDVIFEFVVDTSLEAKEVSAL